MTTNDDDMLTMKLNRSEATIIILESPNCLPVHKWLCVHLYRVKYKNSNDDI